MFSVVGCDGCGKGAVHFLVCGCVFRIFVCWCACDGGGFASVWYRGYWWAAYFFSGVGCALCGSVGGCAMRFLSWVGGGGELVVAVRSFSEIGVSGHFFVVRVFCAFSVCGVLYIFSE